MRQMLALFLVGAALALGAKAAAENPMNHEQHMGSLVVDGRELVSSPPPMRQHMLRNMREHLEAVSDVLAAMADEKYAEAGAIASARLGMDSPAAAGCRTDSTGTSAKVSPTPDIDQHMQQLMPQGMRNLGLAMHQAASDFAIEATKAARTGDGKASLTALSGIIAQCTACHGAYRLR